jgi:hypothetical protein
MAIDRYTYLANNETSHLNMLDSKNKLYFSTFCLTNLSALNVKSIHLHVTVNIR